MRENIKKFLQEKECSNYKINDEDIVYDLYPEDYCFIRKDQEWVFGEVHREKEKIMKTFKSEEEALCYLVFILYVVRLQIMLKKDYTRKAIKLNGKDKLEFIKNIFDKKYLNELKINDNNSLIYKSKYLIEKYLKDMEIEQFYYLRLFELQAFEQTKEELIKYGINSLELDEYFKFENLVVE